MPPYSRPVPRPKAKRPTAVARPDLGAGQADRLRRAREAKGYSLRDLAAAAGVSAKTVISIEEGKEGAGSGAASCVTMASLADALGVPRGWLAFGG